MRSWIRKTISRLAEQRGYTILPLGRLEYLEAATFARDLFSALDIRAVLDVGANVGSYRDFLREQVGFRGDIVSIEPIPSLAQSMMARAGGDRRWRIVECALGASPGKAALNVMASSTFSSFHEPDHSRLSMFEQKNRVVERIEVEVRTLDEFVRELTAVAAPGRMFVKLDTQGFDLAVLQGAKDTLADIAAIQTEMSVIPIYEGAPDYVTTIRALESSGFQLAGVMRNNRAGYPLQLIEFDCVMVSRVAAGSTASA